MDAFLVLKSFIFIIAFYTMINKITLFPIGQAPLLFTVGIDNVASISTSGTAGSTWYASINYNNGTLLQYVGVPYCSETPGSI